MRFSRTACFFRLAGANGQITHVSDNVAKWLGHTPADLLGRTFYDLLAPESLEVAWAALESDLIEPHNPLRLKLLSDIGQELSFDGVAHRWKGHLIVELESSRATDRDFAGFYQSARSATQRLRGAKDLNQLQRGLVEEVRAATGFDRVVLYQFDEEWNGHVVAEALREGLDSYNDLYFPASDIPQQVRALYHLNRLRMIPTVEFKASRILPSDRSPDGEPIDLSKSTLRSVSPIHVEYLRNMKVTGSMSVSLIRNGVLWGLVSCSHESGPNYVSYDARAVVDFLTETASSLLPVYDSENDLQLRAQLVELQGRLLKNMSESENYIQGLLKDPEGLLGIARATGAAIHTDGHWHVVGKCPPESGLRAIREALQGKFKDGLYVTATLSELLENAEELSATVSGVSAFTISKAQTSHFFWFRPEVIQTVNWGGNPLKPAELENDTYVLHPRKSFEIWKQTVRLKSLRWTAEEVRALSWLRSSIIDIVMQRFERITALNSDLERSNAELDSFAYAASHDLKEPLRGIHNYAAILLRDHAKVLPADAQSRLETILRLTQRSEDLINSLLDYSQLGRGELVMEGVDLNAVVRGALDSVRTRVEDDHVEVALENLPPVLGDRVQLTEVFTNLINNAIKYNEASRKKITISYRENGENPSMPIIAVSDNGIGVDVSHHKSVFKIFKRLHGKNKFGGGTGTGLTIAKKIIERHGGGIWIDSKLGSGATFNFTLPRAPN